MTTTSTGAASTGARSSAASTGASGRSRAASGTAGRGARGGDVTERRKPTSTSAFGVGRRESHDASAFYARFTPPRAQRRRPRCNTVDLTVARSTQASTGRRP